MREPAVRKRAAAWRPGVMPACPVGPRGLIVAAPCSGSGKTTVTLALLRLLARRGLAPRPFKTGPDYIDPGFLSKAAGRACRNLDPWAMRPATLARLLVGETGGEAGGELAVCEGVMGLFDGAAAGDGHAGSTAALAELTGWPVVLVVDARGMAGSAAALVRGFAGHRRETRIAAVLFNRVGSHRHGGALRAAMAAALPDLPVLGCLPRIAALAVPDRHLGLVPAEEIAGLEVRLDAAADWLEAAVDAERLLALAAPLRLAVPPDPLPPLPPPGQRIALAADLAFAFAYGWVVEGWRAAGAEIRPFSPLADEPPDAAADAVVLPGGYPELYAGRLAAAGRFLDGLRAAAAGGAAVYGECGGYMVLGRGLCDGSGVRHRMAGLLPLETSFAAPRLHLGYRRLRTLATGGPLGAAGLGWRGHEFHYASVTAEGPAPPLFACTDAGGIELAPAGLAIGRVAGSFHHLVDRAPV